MLKQKLKKQVIQDCYIKMQQNSIFKNELEKNILQTNIKLEKLEDDHSIQIFIKEKEMQFKNIENSDLTQLMNKYERNKKDQEFKLRMLIIHINKDDFVEYKFDIKQVLSQYQQIKAKKILILENLKDYFKHNQVIQELSIINNTQSKICKNKIQNQYQLDELLIESNLIFDFDYFYTDNIQQGIKFIDESIVRLVTLNKNLNQDVYNAKNKPVGKFKDFAMEGVYTLSWLTMLMNIVGMNEEKAVAIVKIYPTYLQLMNAYQSQKKDDRHLMLENCQIQMKNKDKITKVGPALSKRIYKIFHENDPKTKLNK